MCSVFKHILTAIIPVLGMTVMAACSNGSVKDEVQLLQTSSEHEISTNGEALPHISTSIIANRDAILAATFSDFSTLTESDRSKIFNDLLPNLTNTEWGAILEKLSEGEWEKLLNKRVINIMNQGCDMIRYKWVYYQEADNVYLDYDRHDTFPAAQTLCITENFESIRGPASSQQCIKKIHPVNRTSETLTCEAGPNNIPKSFVPLTDIGENQHALVSNRCKFRQKILLHYPTCESK